VRSTSRRRCRWIYIRSASVSNDVASFSALLVERAKRRERQAANEASLFADQAGILVDEPMHKYLLNQLRAARRCLGGSRPLDLVLWI
jgi:hypothetical protein